jgi:hypothetical protein
LPSAKSRSLILAVIILLIAVVVVPVPTRSIGIEVLHDFGHGPIFGIVAVAALLWLREHGLGGGVGAQYALAFASSIGLGALVELIQIPIGRDASWLDVRSDLLGAFGFLALFALVDGRVRNVGTRVLAAIAGVAALTVHSLPLVQSTLAYLERNAAFPVLFDARERYDDYFLAYFEATGEHATLPNQYARSAGEKALLLHLQHHWSPRLTLLEPVPDWRGQKALAFDLTNAASEPLALKIGVRDRDYDARKKDGFVRVVTLLPEQRIVVRIPIEEIESGGLTRRVDVARIGSVVLFDEYAERERDVYVSRVWVE